MRRKVTTHYLEMTDAAQHRRAASPDGGLRVAQSEVPCPEVNRFFYTAVGGDWYWVDRLPWTYHQWMKYLDRPELETWIAWVAGAPAGYFELEILPDSGVEIVYFGLLPQFVGRKIGGSLLSIAVDRAWSHKPWRVWLHTCSDDHPHALGNYQARGFRIFRVVDEEKELPVAPVGPWPGAREDA